VAKTLARGSSASAARERGLRPFVRLEGGEASVAPTHAHCDLIDIERLPLREDALEVIALIEGGIGGT
jgi:hypothetical protein